MYNVVTITLLKSQTSDDDILDVVITLISCFRCFFTFFSFLEMSRLAPIFCQRRHSKYAGKNGVVSSHELLLEVFKQVLPAEKALDRNDLEHSFHIFSRYAFTIKKNDGQEDEQCTA